MNSEKRQQKELDRRMTRIWQSFKDVGQERQTLLTDHVFSFHIDDIGAGWEYVHFTLDDESHGCRISYIGPGVSDFVDALTSLDKNQSIIFTWYDEPGEYTWTISRRNDFVYVEAPYAEEGFFLKYDYLRNQIREGCKRAGYRAD